MNKNYEIINGQKRIIKKPELLAPAGNLEKLKVAVLYGANAVFIGGREFSLRSGASNFTYEDIQEGVEFAHQHGAHIHVTCNIILHNENIDGLEDHLRKLDDIGVDAIIVADPYIMKVALGLNLKLEVHASTQLSILNSEAISLFEEIGCHRVVLGRETSFEDLKKIREKCDLDLEYFIHGAMCINYSGRCMLSNYFSRRDANRGGCSQSCRWFYDIEQDGVMINDDETIPFSMSSKDMALVDHIPELIDIGVNSFKIEGRMKSLHYIATIVSTYRKLIDDYCDDPDHFVYDDHYLKELNKAANRAFCEGFFHGYTTKDDQLFNLRDEHPTQDFCMRVLDYDDINNEVKIEQRNYFKKGDYVEFFSSHHDNITYQVDQIYNEDHELVDVANHPMEILYLPIKEKLFKDDMGRKLKQ